MLKVVLVFVILHQSQSLAQLKINLDQIKRLKLNYLSLPVFNFTYAKLRNTFKSTQVPYCNSFFDHKEIEKKAKAYFSQREVLSSHFVNNLFEIQDITLGLYKPENQDRLICLFQVEIESKSPMGSWNLYIDPISGQVTNFLSTSCNYSSGTGVSIYGDSEKQIHEVSLNLLEGTGYLESENFKVINEPFGSFFNDTNNFVVNFKDLRFEESQVYYLNQILSDLFTKQFQLRPYKFLKFYVYDPDAGDNGFYLSSQRGSSIRIGNSQKNSRIGQDPDISLHELGHYWLEMILESKVENTNSEIQAMNEGFADFIAAHVTNDTQIGELYEGNGNGRDFSKPIPDSQDSHILGLKFTKLLWEIRNNDPEGFNLIVLGFRHLETPISIKSFEKGIHEADMKFYNGKFQEFLKLKLSNFQL